MHNLFSAFSILAVVSISTAAAAQNETMPPPAPEKKICRSENVTGSMMAKRVCHTRSEWSAINAANEAATDNTLRQRQGMPSRN